MPWQEVTQVSLREEFVKLASQQRANRRELCRRFKISAKTGYKWLARYRQEGREGLEDRSRRPHHSPARSCGEVEQAVVELRGESRNCWGGRKIARLLSRAGLREAPAPSTVTGILRRHGLIEPPGAAQRRPWRRFERGAANELWQMDFKGHFALAHQRCYPLTVLDDHSRFALAVRACTDQRNASAQRALREAFERYGLPAQMLMDNGPPWGTRSELTEFTVWLIRLGIRVIHGRPRHPQTQGKDERFHRTLKLEVLRGCRLTTLSQCQSEFDRFRDRYNLVRPHDALGLEVPASRYQPSPVPLPANLPPIESPDDMAVRKIQAEGWFSFRGRDFRLSKALHGYPVGLRTCDAAERRFEVFFCHQLIAEINLIHPHAAD